MNEQPAKKSSTTSPTQIQTHAPYIYSFDATFSMTFSITLLQNECNIISIHAHCIYRPQKNGADELLTSSFILLMHFCASICQFVTDENISSTKSTGKQFWSISLSENHAVEHLNDESIAKAIRKNDKTMCNIMIHL